MRKKRKNQPIPKPKEQIIPEVNAPIDAAFDGGQEATKAKLDTGMEVGVAISGASVWWDRTGRAAMHDRNKATDNPGFGSFTADPQNETEAENNIPSGILAGKLWVDLTRAEQLTVVKQWHHETIRRPNVDPELYLRTLKRPGICFYCQEEAMTTETLGNEFREMCWPHFLDRYPDAAEQHMKEQIRNGGRNDN